MSRSQSTSGVLRRSALLLMAFVLGAVAVPAGSARAAEGAPVGDSGQRHLATPGADLRHDVAARPETRTDDLRRAYSVGGRAWPGRTIRYFSLLRGAKADAVRRAAQSWNSAKLPVRFAPARSRGSSQVIIRQRKRGWKCGPGAAGCADLGYAPGHRSQVVLTGSGRRILFDRNAYVSIVVHELGHVLGLDHSNRSTSVMLPVNSFTAMRWHSQGRCRYFGKDDLKGLRRLYGGKGSLRLVNSCLFYPEAGRVPGVSAVVHGSGYISLGWPATANASTYAVVRSAAGGACPEHWNDRPKGGTSYSGIAITSFDDFGITEGARYCYSVFALNRDGFASPSHAARASVTAVVTAPAAPTGVGVAVASYGGFAWGVDFSGLPDPNADHAIYASFHAGTCAGFDEATTVFASAAGPDVTLSSFEYSAGQQVCVRLWDVAQGFGGNVVSRPVDRMVTLPVLEA